MPNLGTIALIAADPWHRRPPALMTFGAIALIAADLGAGALLRY